MCSFRLPGVRRRCRNMRARLPSRARTPSDGIREAAPRPIRVAARTVRGLVRPARISWFRRRRRCPARRAALASGVSWSRELLAETERDLLGRCRRGPRPTRSPDRLSYGRGGSAPADLMRRARLTNCALRRNRWRRTRGSGVTAPEVRFVDRTRRTARTSVPRSHCSRSLLGGPNNCKTPGRPSATFDSRPCLSSGCFHPRSPVR